MTEQEKTGMLWSRAGFGTPLQALTAPGRTDETLARLLHIRMPLPLEVITEEEWQENNPKALKAAGMAGDELKMKQKSFREKAVELGLLWMRQMVLADNPLQEKMALFWHGHFATRTDNPYFDQLLLQDIRAGALGRFGDLLRAISTSPGMLKFLNNQQNRKAHPNENFAREVMELFTLGRGNYSETDVQEAARAFTGWTYDEDGEFVFKEGQHDSGAKTFLGKKGAFTGDDILNILLEQRQTAKFITRKIYRFFVNEEVADNARIDELSGIFYDSGYDVARLMRAIFSADWFYSSMNRGAHIKSPVELLVGLQQTVPVEFANERTLLTLQRILGQQLFYPPNVAGWPGGKAWIDASSLVIRMRLPEAIYTFKEFELRAKEIDAEMTDVNKTPMMQDSGKVKNFKVGKAEADWSAHIAYWQRVDEAKLPRLLANYLLAVPVSESQLQTAVRFSSRASSADFIKTLTIRLMSLPDYQLA